MQYVGCLNSPVITQNVHCLAQLFAPGLPSSGFFESSAHELSRGVCDPIRTLACAFWNMEREYVRKGHESSLGSCSNQGRLPSGHKRLRAQLPSASSRGFATQARRGIGHLPRLTPRPAPRPGQPRSGTTRGQCLHSKDWPVTLKVPDLRRSGPRPRLGANTVHTSRQYAPTQVPDAELRLGTVGSIVLRGAARVFSGALQPRLSWWIRITASTCRPHSNSRAPSDPV